MQGEDEYINLESSTANIVSATFNIYCHNNKDDKHTHTGSKSKPKDIKKGLHNIRPNHVKGYAAIQTT